MPEHDAPAELRAIGQKCPYFKSGYPTELENDLMGGNIISCDMCQHWDNGYCNIYLQERFGESMSEDTPRI